MLGLEGDDEASMADGDVGDDRLLENMMLVLEVGEDMVISFRNACG